MKRYALHETLDSGQAFQWQHQGDSWTGVIGSSWIQVRQTSDALEFTSPHRGVDWTQITHYFQTDLDIDAVVAQFPDDPHMNQAVLSCRGLRLLRQDPWECLASFILSSTKQIRHIKQIVRALADRYGDPVAVPDGTPPARTFPSAQVLAETSEAALRKLGMGYRAPYLRETAQAVATKKIHLARLHQQSYDEAKKELIALPGVGPKIADCVMLFAYGMQEAFPIDVWIERSLRELYFPNRQPSKRALQSFANTYFSPFGGYAQQYLFHYRRIKQTAAP